MNNETTKPVFNRRYEISGNPLPRQAWHWMRMKTTIMGNYDTGPGLKNLVTLWLIHYIGRPVFWLRARFNNQHRLKRMFKTLLPSRFTRK